MIPHESLYIYLAKNVLPDILNGTSLVEILLEETSLEAADSRHFVSQMEPQENESVQKNYLKHLQKLNYIFKVDLS